MSESLSLHDQIVKNSADAIKLEVSLRELIDTIRGGQSRGLKVSHLEVTTGRLEDLHNCAMEIHDTAQRLMREEMTAVTKRKQSLKLIVIKTDAVEESAEFYRAQGLVLVPEKHGDGHKHYSCDLGETVLEIYGSNTRKEPLRLDFEARATDKYPAGAETNLLHDPNGNRIKIKYV